MRTLNIVKRIVRQMVNDKRSLGLILIVPIFLFTLIFLLLGDSDYKASIAVNGIPAQFAEKIEGESVSVINLELVEGREAVKRKEIDALLYKAGSEMVLLMETSDTVKLGVIQKAIQNAMKDINPSAIMQMEYVYGKSNDSMFNSLGYVLLGIISFFLIFIIAGISFVRERTNQTMERLMITPVKRWQVVLGYTIGFGLFAMLQSVILLCYVRWVLQMEITGSMVAAAFIMILMSMTAVCIGAFCSIFANNEFQMMQFIPVVVIPQIFFSGLISLDTLPYNLGILSKGLPVYYACRALKAITIKGSDLSGVIPEIIALLIFIGLFFVLNIFALKKYRRI